MSRPTESAIEDFAIKLFERLGYDYFHARMATDCSQLKQMACGMRCGIPPVPTPEKCSAIQVAPTQKPFTSSPEKCYSFSGIYVCVMS